MIDVAFASLRLLAAILLVLLNGFFVASEFAYVRIRATAVDQLVRENRRGAAMLDEAMNNLDDYLAVTQLGITLSSLSLGWIGEPAVAALIEPLLAPVLTAETIHYVAIVVGFTFITFLHVVFGELAPKTIAIAKAEQIALLVAPPMKAFYYLFMPGIIVFNGTANFCTRLIGIPPASESEETLSEEEILTVLSRAGTAGNIDMEEVEMIERIFDLDDVPVRAIIVPRPDVVSVPPTLSLSDLRSLIGDAGHTRYPVIDEESDEVLGFVDVKDVLQAMDENGTGEGITAGDISRDIPLVPETVQVIDLLTMFQSEQRQMAAVIDEWGAFEGIATVEDAIEMIVGDIQDQFDAADPEPAISNRADDASVANGSVSLAAVNEELETAFDSGNVDTIGGLVLERLGRVPEVGDRITEDEYEITVEAVDGSRISSVEIRESTEEDSSTG